MVSLESPEGRMSCRRSSAGLRRSLMRLDASLGIWETEEGMACICAICYFCRELPLVYCFGDLSLFTGWASTFFVACSVLSEDAATYFDSLFTAVSFPIVEAVY